MKLKKKVGKRPIDICSDDRFHCCRYCHYFIEGRCYNKKVGAELSNDAFMNVVDVAESGKLSGVLEETIHSNYPKDMVKELSGLLRTWKISNARINEFEQNFNELFDQWADFTLKDEIDCAVDMLYQNNAKDDSFDGIEISNPENYYCKEYM